MDFHFFYLKKLKETKIPRIQKRVSPSKPEHFINKKIPFNKVYVLSEKGEKLGFMSKQEAINEAENKGLDLVLISQNAKQPVAKILDYGKFKYQRSKKRKEAKIKQAVTNNKEVRLTPMIGVHDLMTKSKKARGFLLDGDRVKVSLKFRGREMARKDLGYEKLNEFFETLKDIAEIQKPPSLNGGRFLDMYLQKLKTTGKKSRKEVDENAENKN